MTGRRPQGLDTGSDTTREQEATHGPGRGRNRDCGAEKEDTTAGTRAHTQEGHATTEAPAPPHPQRTPRGPWRSTPRTHAAEARIERPPETTQGKEGTPTRGEGATTTREAAENTAPQPTTTPAPPDDDPGHSKGHLTGTGSTYDFSSCFFPKFKTSTKRGFSRGKTYSFGFYGLKIGGGVFLPKFCSKISKTLKFGLFWAIFASSGLVLENSAAH